MVSSCVLNDLGEGKKVCKPQDSEDLQGSEGLFEEKI